MMDFLFLEDETLGWMYMRTYTRTHAPTDLFICVYMSTRVRRSFLLQLAFLSFPFRPISIYIDHRSSSYLPYLC